MFFFIHNKTYHFFRVLTAVPKDYDLYCIIDNTIYHLVMLINHQTSIHFGAIHKRRLYITDVRLHSKQMIGMINIVQQFYCSIIPESLADILKN